MQSSILLTLFMSIIQHENRTEHHHNLVQPNNLEKWLSYKEQFNKSYVDHREEFRRFHNFIENDKKIKSHNQKFMADEVSFEIGHNDFSDLSREEFLDIYLRPIDLPKWEYDEPNFDSEVAVPDAISFQSYCFAPLQQGTCGACWAFASAAQVEVHLRMKNNHYDFYISPQYLLDCSQAGSCGGGFPSKALDWMKIHGLVALIHYDYVGHEQPCHTNVPLLNEKIISNTHLTLSGDENHLKQVVGSVGPVVTAMFATGNLIHYTNGVYYDAQCPNDCHTTNHIMVIVGYGHDPVLKADFWLVKNSWGDWGEGGYVRMVRNHGNNCNIACFINYSTV